MVVRLLGDVSGYMRSMDQAVKGTQASVKKIEEQTSQIKKFQGALEGYAKSAASLLASIGLGGFLKGTFESFAKVESTTLRLSGAIAMNGKNVQETMTDYRTFAQAMFDLTGTSKLATLEILRHAEIMGISGEAAKRVATNAVALQGALGGEAEHYVRISVALEQGNIHMLQRLLHMHGVHDQSLILARAQAMLTQGLEQAKLMAGTAAGQWNKLQQTLSVLRTELGGVLAEGFLPVIQAVQALVDWFNSWDPALKRVLGTIIAVTVAITLLGVVSKALAIVGGLLSAGWSALMVVLTVLHAVAMIPVTLAVIALKVAFIALGAVVAIVKTIIFIFTAIALSPLILIGGALLLVILALTNGWRAFGRFMGAVGDAIGSVLSGIWDVIRTIGGAIGDFFSGLWDGLKALAGGIGNLFRGVGPALGNLRNLSAGLSGNMQMSARHTEKFNAALVGSAEAFGRIQRYQDSIRSPILPTTPTGTGGPNAPNNLFGGVAETLRKVAADTWKWIQDKASGVWEWIKSIAVGVWNWIKDTAVRAWLEIKLIAIRVYAEILRLLPGSDVERARRESEAGAAVLDAMRAVERFAEEVRVRRGGLTDVEAGRVQEAINRILSIGSALTGEQRAAVTPIAEAIEQAIRAGNPVTPAMISDLVAVLQRVNAVASTITPDTVRDLLVNVGSVPLIPRLPPGMQHGGPVSGGHPYMVGERGPELFVPHSAGAIIPHMMHDPRIVARLDQLIMLLQTGRASFQRANVLGERY